MVIKRYLTILAGAAVAYCSSYAIAAAQTGISPLQQIALTASNAGVPIGIIVSDDSLCVPQPYVPQVGESTKTPSDRIVQIATAHGYKAQAINSLVIRNVATGSANKKAEAFANKYQAFPTLTGTMGYMGAILNGWIISYLDPKAGYAIDWATGSQAETVTLPPLTNVSVVEVASKVVSLGQKGLWIADVRPPDPSRQSSDIHLRIFSYADNRDKILSLNCE